MDHAAAATAALLSLHGVRFLARDLTVECAVRRVVTLALQTLEAMTCSQAPPLKKRLVFGGGQRVLQLPLVGVRRWELQRCLPLVMRANASPH